MKLKFSMDPKDFWPWFAIPIMWMPLLVLLSLYAVAKIVIWMH